MIQRPQSRTPCEETKADKVEGSWIFKELKTCAKSASSVIGRDKWGYRTFIEVKGLNLNHTFVFRLNLFPSIDIGGSAKCITFVLDLECPCNQRRRLSRRLEGSIG